jgi:hypothetical protein
MPGTDTISIRVHPMQKAALRALSEASGRTLTEFILEAALGRASSRLDAFRSAARMGRSPSPRSSRRNGGQDRPRPGPMSFRLPSMPGDHGAPFEEVVREVAVRMRTDPHTVAIALTYFAEGLGRIVAGGRVFRWPGVFVVGPYRVEREHFACCLPRFQANPPLKQLVWEDCPPELGRNRELDAHRRRRRPERKSSLETFMRQQRHAICLQDLRIIESMDSDWRLSSPTHFAS